MACDAQSLATLSATNKYPALSERDRLICTAKVFAATAGVATAQLAVTLANTYGYSKFDDGRLQEAFLAAILPGACDANSLSTTIATQKYDSLCDCDGGMVAVASYCAGSGFTAQTGETAAVNTNGYLKLSRDGLDQALLASACSGSCSAQTLITSAYTAGFSALSDRSLREVVVACAC